MKVIGDSWRTYFCCLIFLLLGVELIFGFDRVSFFSAASVPVHMVFMPPAVIVQESPVIDIGHE